MKLRMLAGILLALFAPAMAVGGEVSFSAKPSVAKDGDTTKISFKVSVPTDVEVAVLDKDGKVVRHLAAGVLGAKNPPPDPLKAGLAQELVWDGRDDFGAPPPPTVHPPPFRVRVRAGTQLKVGAVLAADPLYVCYPQSMATDDAGNLYFLSSSSVGRDFASLRVFNRKGEYLRTVLPMPGGLPLEKAKLFDAVQTGPASWSPRNRCSTWPDFYRKESFSAGTSYQLASRVGKDGVLNLCNNGSLLRLAPDGSPAGAGPQPIPLAPGKKVPGAGLAPYFYAAASPDGARVYLSGLGGKGAGAAVFPPGRILVWDGKEIKAFADVKLGDKVKGSIPRVNYTDLAGMACDVQGNLYVCDPTSATVRVFDPQGKETGGFAVESALRVVPHRRTGEIYVLCVNPGYTKGRKVLRKFGPLKDGAKELASLALPDSGEDGCMALDDSADPAVVWVAVRAGHSQFNFGAQARVLRLEDKGAAFAETPHPISFPLDGIKERLAVHPETELVIYRGQFCEAGAVNGLTAEKVALPFKKCIDMAAGQDGNWYIQVTGSWQGHIGKYDRDLKPVPANYRVQDGKAPENAAGFAFGKYGWGISTAGLAADFKGRVFSHTIGNEHVDGGYFVVVFGPDGKPEEFPWAKGNPKFDDHLYDYGGKKKIRENRFFNSALVALLTEKDWHYGNQGGGLQIDLQGNVYVGTMLYPADGVNPAGYEKDRVYDTAVGSVFKFPREGGQLLNIHGEPPAGKKGLTVVRRFWPKGKVFAENAAAVYPGLGSFAGGVGTGCSCRKPTFAVDGFGRLAIPNAITFRVHLLDNAGNEIMEIGKYGNEDALVGPLKAVQEALPAGDPLKKLELSAARPENLNALLKARPLPVSEAAFGWPQAAAASERALYVADVYNHCIVRLDRGAAAEESLEVK
jgi:hypothetical protein